MFVGRTVGFPGKEAGNATGGWWRAPIGSAHHVAEEAVLVVRWEEVRERLRPTPDLRGRWDTEGGGGGGEEGEGEGDIQRAERSHNYNTHCIITSVKFLCCVHIVTGLQGT